MSKRSRFNKKTAARIADQSGIPGKGTKLLPLLCAAEAAHDAVLQAKQDSEAEARDMRERWVELADKHAPFVKAQKRVIRAWHEMDDDARQSLAWVAAFCGNGDPVRAWLAAALHNASPSAKSPYVNYSAIEERIVHLLTLPIDLATEMEPYRRSPGDKKLLAGLEAANAAFHKSWKKVGGNAWRPRYDRADTKAGAYMGELGEAADCVEAKVFLRFAQLVGPYTVANCSSASGGQGHGMSKEEYKKRRKAASKSRAK